MHNIDAKGSGEVNGDQGLKYSGAFDSCIISEFIIHMVIDMLSMISELRIGAQVKSWRVRVIWVGAVVIRVVLSIVWSVLEGLIWAVNGPTALASDSIAEAGDHAIQTIFI